MLALILFGAISGATGSATGTSTIVIDGSKEEDVDLEAEEQRSKEEDQRVKASTGGSAGGESSFGVKLFVDLLLDWTIGEKKFEFRPNHTYVFLQLSISSDLQFILHISESPIFFEITYNVTPRLSLSAGKILIPFGTNEFHHIIGGRVDELSRFLPETWGDYGLALNHLVYDSELFAAEYTVYAVNGFSGSDGPVIAEGSISDNNYWKALGTRVRLTFLSKIRFTTSTYFDAWDTDNKNKVLFYALGLELNTGLIDAPVLRDMRLRVEWGRGEIQIPDRNYQHGILDYAYARSGYYAELQYSPHWRFAARMRAGRINADNTTTDEADLEVYEPALLFAIDKKLWFTLAYQFLKKPNASHTPKDPGDVVYAKIFLQY